MIPLLRVLRWGLLMGALALLSEGRPQNAGRPTQGRPAPAILIDNVTVIDGTGRAPFPADLLLADGRIAQIGGSIFPPARATVVDGAGKFAVPGLIDVHVHLDSVMAFQVSDEERAEIIRHTPRAFLYNGVTTVLNLSSNPDWIWERRAAERAGRELSPRIYAMGRSFTPEGGWGSRHGGALKSAEDARARVREYVANGADGLKVVLDASETGAGTFYRMMPDDILQAIAREGHAAGLPLYVHAITRPTYERALSIRPRAIVHGLEDPLLENDPLLEALVKGRVAVVPTLSLWESFTRLDEHAELFDDEVLEKSVPTFLLANMRRPEFMRVERERYRAVKRRDDLRAWVRQKLPIFQKNTKRMHAAGVRIAAGTDGGGPTGYNFQGFNTPREVELLVESGLTPMEALVSATRTGAEVIGSERTSGTLEAGKRADLLLLAADPLGDIRNIRRIETVVLGGRLYPRDQLAYRRGTGSEQPAGARGKRRP